MWQVAFRLAADPSVSVIGTLMNVTFWTVCCLATIAEDGKVFADQSPWVDANMCIATGRFRTVSTKEMQAGRDSFRRRIMGKVAGIAGRTAACLEILFAYGDLGGIMNIRTERASRAMS